MLAPDDCYPLRALLLGGEPTLEEAGFPQDLDEGALHLGFKEKDTLLCVVSILPDRRDGKREMWRLDGLVVDPGHRGQGLGRKLAVAAQTIVSERGGGLWAEAPTSAGGFLEACGMTAAKAKGKATKSAPGRWVWSA